MVRRVVLSILLAALAGGGVLCVAADDPPFEPAGGKGKKAKKDKGDGTDKTEKWAMKLAKADPETAERWMIEKAMKEQQKAEKSFLKDQMKAEKFARKFGDEPPAKVEEKPDPRPTVVRAGALPKELPKWWEEVDADKDAQLSLFEWRTAGKNIAEFVALDLNNDGYLTVEEYLRATKAEK